MKCLDIIPANEDEFYKSFIDTNHPSGGLILSNKSNKGFCDFNQKVWNTKNVYVNGPCIFPNSSYANIGLNIMAFTKKLAKIFKN